MERRKKAAQAAQVRAPKWRPFEAAKWHTWQLIWDWARWLSIRLPLSVDEDEMPPPSWEDSKGIVAVL